MVTIERITPDTGCDVAQLNRLVSTMAQEHDFPRKPMTEESVAKLISNPDFHLIVARDGEEYLGLVTVIFQPDLGGQWLCGIYNLLTVRSIRNRGVGDLLRDAAYETLKEFSRRENIELHTYFRTNSPYVKGTAAQRRHGAVLVAEAVGDMGTNFFKVITRPGD